MGLYRDEAGTLIEVDDRFAEARGYVPADAVDLAPLVGNAAVAERVEQRGTMGKVSAALTGAASSLTLGLSDVALANTLTPFERERLQMDLEANPGWRTAGEIGGAVTGGLAMPGSLLAKTTPGGYLGAATARGVEAGLAQGGVRGTAKALNAMGIEGAIQNAGQYIGHSAIADKETTVEGLAGSLGTGYGFGAAGGGAVLGVTKGAMAARRLYSRVMDGKKAAEAAQSSWSLASQEALDADTATLRAAETKLEQIRVAKMEAQRGRNEARGAAREAKMAEKAGPDGETLEAQTSSFEPPMGPEPLIDVGPQTGPGGVTSKFQRPDVAFDATDAKAFDEGMPSARDQVNDVARDIKPGDKGAKTGAYKRPEGSTTRITSDAPADLEGQLAGTKAKLDEGAAFKDIKGVKPPKAGKGNESNSIEGWLQEKKLFDDAELDAARMHEDIKGADALRNRRETALREIRFKATEDLLGPQMAKTERELQEIVDEYNVARKELGDLSDGIPEPLDGGEISRAVRGEPAPRPNQTAKASPAAGKRQARQIVDDAHEEALLRAKYGADPQEAGRAITEAEELENLLNKIDDVSDGVPRMVDGTPQEMFADQLAADIKKIWRYEEASAKMADVIGEASHPTSLQKAKAFRDAAKESERKVMDRAARAVDDAEHFGPIHKTPKQRLNDAQKHFDELGVQEKEARDAFGKAGKKVREGEKAKREALRADAKAARETAAQAGKFGAAEAGGVYEILDLPGLPKPSDLPIIGPLLGAYLKFRTLKQAIGRRMGRVPATADAQVAARASQTRDRIARAVDRSLGLVERSGKYAARAMPPTAGILAHRIFDDGGEDPGPKAPLQKQAAARMREINAYVLHPHAIELDVRRELRGVTDPDLIASAEKHRRFMMEYIARHLPKMPEQGLIKTHDWEPSPGQAMSLARRLEAVNDPAASFEKLAQERDLISIEAAETLREVYPKLFQEALRRAMERTAEAPGKISYRTRVQMSVFYKQPFDAALMSENFAITQSVYDRSPSTPMPASPAPSGAPPTPSVAQPTNLSQEYMPSFDRS